jgi:hypothetical protein
MIHDPEAVLGHEVVIGPLHLGVRDQGQRGPGRADRRQPQLAPHQGAAQQVQGPGTLARGRRMQIGRDRGRDRGLPRLLLLLPAPRPGGQRRIRESGPQALLVRGQTQGARIESGRELPVAHGPCRAGVGDQTRQRGKAWRARLRDQGLGELLRRLHGLRRHERELREAQLLQIRARRRPLHDAPRDRAREGACLGELRLQEAPARLDVVGKGRAAPIRETGRLAGLQLDPLEDLEVLTEVVRPLAED